jgi:hypothetical protein
MDEIFICYFLLFWIHVLPGICLACHANLHFVVQNHCTVCYYLYFLQDNCFLDDFIQPLFVSCVLPTLLICTYRNQIIFFSTLFGWFTFVYTSDGALVYFPALFFLKHQLHFLPFEATVLR